MDKADVVASLGQSHLLRPTWVKAALRANDRLKVYLTLVQAAWANADGPTPAPIDLGPELAGASIKATWLKELPGTAFRTGSVLNIPDLPRVMALLREDLLTMARPLTEGNGDSDLQQRVSHWRAWLETLSDGTLDEAQLQALTGGNRRQGDSVHILIMDLHKALNHMAADLSDETVDGAHVWQLEAPDRPRVAAFMRGLNRTRALKLDHPGLDTAATRDGERLLLQNDIGTNDAHVLVVQVEALHITLTYSDLHRQRFSFFQTLLRDIGAHWSTSEARTTRGLNAGNAYYVGTADFACDDEASLQQALEGIGARIVFLIDWNRARKRLVHFVKKPSAVAVLEETSRREVGHMAWLAAGAERLVYDAMQALGSDYFHIGERLDQVLGDAATREFLVEALTLASQSTREGQSPSLIADETRLLLLRHLQRRRDEFDLLSEHAAYCHALAEGLRDALAHGHYLKHQAAERLSERAKEWEHQADLMVMRSRSRADLQPRWRPFAGLIERADDVADHLEEAAFLLSLIAEAGHEGWQGDVQHAMQRLADEVLTATQDHVKALAIAGTLDEQSSAMDHEEFVAALWRVLSAERRSDSLLREVRRALMLNVSHAATLNLATEFSTALEQATDALLATGFGLRKLAFSRMGDSL
ncbi:MAG: phosphate transport regulator [Pseudomonadota bacterium]